MQKALEIIKKKYLHLKKQENRGVRNFIIRFVLFLTSYFLISHFYTDLKLYLKQGHFEVYNSYLSNFIYFAIAIVIYTRSEQIKSVPNYKQNWLQSIIFLAAATYLALLPTFRLKEFLPFEQIINYFINFSVIQFLIFLSIFNLRFITKYFRLETALILIITLLSMASYLLVREYWTLIFIPIALSLDLVLPFFSDNVAIEHYQTGFIVDLPGFRAAVGPPCSGVTSMIAFTLLFCTTIFFARKKQKISNIKTIIAYLSGLTSLYILNILRIAIILLVGAHYSPELAIDLFHEYLSAVFLMALFIFYLHKIIPRLSPKSTLR